MKVFGDYARYYDLLYRDKDYASEAEYVHTLIQKHSPGARTILNLGCGSGRHDRELSERGYCVTGVDLSEDMLNMARKNRSSTETTYQQGDIRTIRLGKTFDVVISLFHVMSYLVTNDDLLEALATSRAHLNTGGLFLFDCWYGPGVMSDPPVVRVKELEDESVTITRIAQPELFPNENRVNVNYKVFVESASDGVVRQIQETHAMRYFFLPELELFLRQSGFNMVTSCSWMTTNPLDLKSWYASVICKATQKHQQQGVS